ncbi:MAG: SUMF1/EgtB/PvdO family nonheme iron enzyme [Spirochaetaceae bacterium]|jgi:hypothetical protein|nr:SUMF1/EgtB/PvdO family nonheme iron enzyme [Spirochaetaceae bacterium]
MSDANQTDQVRLKPLFGLRPGVWLSVLFALILLVILFFLLVYPGLSRPGSLVTFTTEPLGAAIRVDGVYRGTSPCSIVIPQGTHRLEMGIPGFSTLSLERDIPGRLLGSRFFPRRVSVEGRLEAADPLEPLRRAAAEYAAWAFAGEPAAAWQIPQVLSEGVYRSAAAASDPAFREGMDGILAGSLGYTVTRAALRDLLRARFLLDNRGLSPSPLSAIRSGRLLLATLAASPGAAPALAELLEGDAAARLTASSWYALSLVGREAGALRRANAPGAPGIPALGRSLNLGGVEFVYLDGGYLEPGSLRKAERLEIEGFWISRYELGAAQWEAFTGAEPRWDPSRREGLIREGLAGPGYLEHYSPPAGTGPTGVQGVSWYAAKAYCDWLDASYRERVGAFEVRLPEEDEWEYAARLAPGAASNQMPAQMLGGLWEWCGDYHVPLSFFPGPEAPSPERNLRGGAWINPPGSVNAGTRASLPPDACSPFVSFRPVIARPASGKRAAEP